jgi:hypothetical protein
LIVRLRGIHYDVRTLTIEGTSTRPTLTTEEIERDIADIAHGLHANAIRITGDDVARLAATSEVAARYGLEAWLSPMIPNADPATTLTRIAETARVAEDVRHTGQTSVLVVGCELSVFMAGILPGATHAERFALLSDPTRLVAEVTASGRDPQTSFADFLRTAVATARSAFHGQITYASGMWETVDWSGFDMIGVDAYRDASNRAAYSDMLRALARQRQPVVITEFGCATYRGAADAGGLAWTAIERGAEPRRLREGIMRDEAAQAQELAGLLATAESSGMDGAFIYTYVMPSYPSSLENSEDLDAASYALVRCWPDGRIEPKAAYHAVAQIYGGHD